MKSLSQQSKHGGKFLLGGNFKALAGLMSA